MKPPAQSIATAPRPFPIGRRVLTVTELAARWGCTDQHVHDLIEEGKLQAIDVGGGSKRFWRIPFEATEQFETVNSSLFDPASGTILPPSPLPPTPEKPSGKPVERRSPTRLARKERAS